MDEIVNPVEGNYPRTLLDYTPVKLEYAENNGIDLQLSGYTHHRKVWPRNIITNLIYEINWGTRKKGRHIIILLQLREPGDYPCAQEANLKL